MLLHVVFQSEAVILQALHGKAIFIRNENGDVKEEFFFPLHGLPLLALDGKLGRAFGSY